MAKWRWKDVEQLRVGVEQLGATLGSTASGAVVLKPGAIEQRCLACMEETAATSLCMCARRGCVIVKKITAMHP